MRRTSYFLFFLPSLLLAAPTISEEEGTRRIQAHFLIEDYSSALREAERFYEQFPNSYTIASSYIEALAANGMEEKALESWNRLSLKFPAVIKDRHLLEELAWGVIQKGLNSSQYAVRLSAMIGAYLTRDVRAVSILLRMMRDSNAVIRSVAVQMAASFPDAALRDEICRLFSEERIWFVKLEVIKVAGALRIKQLSQQLQAILSSEKNTFEERRFAAEALVRITDTITLPEFALLAKNNRAGMRHFACMLASHFRLVEAKEDLLQLASDSNPNVRIAALTAIGLLYPNNPSLSTFLVAKAQEDPHSAVSITAAWALAIIDPKESEAHFRRWIKNDLPENRRLAAAALSATGSRGSDLAEKILEESSDPYVRANIAIGLIGQRKNVPRCAEILYSFLMNEKKMWMWDDRVNPLFNTLAPSQIRHVDQIPNYPEAIDQMTRLNLASLLAVIEDPRAQDALKSFLQNKRWGITGVAAATLLQEGDESAMEAVRGLLEDKDLNVRLQACFVLAFLSHDETVIPQLQSAYLQSDHERKLHILEALGNIGREESYSFFISVFREPFQILRVAAAAGLIQSLNR